MIKIKAFEQAISASCTRLVLNLHGVIFGFVKCINDIQILIFQGGNRHLKVSHHERNTEDHMSKGEISAAQVTSNSAAHARNDHPTTSPLVGFPITSSLLFWLSTKLVKSWVKSRRMVSHSGACSAKKKYTHGSLISQPKRALFNCDFSLSSMCKNLLKS